MASPRGRLLVLEGIHDNCAGRQGIVALVQGALRSGLRRRPALRCAGCRRSLCGLPGGRIRTPLPAWLACLARLAWLAVKEGRARLLGKLKAAGTLGAGGDHDAVRHAVCRHVALVAALGAANKHGRAPQQGRHRPAREDESGKLHGFPRENRLERSDSTEKALPLARAGLGRRAWRKRSREPGTSGFTWPCHAGTLATARHFRCPPHAGLFPARLLRAYHAPPDIRLVQVSRRRPGEEASTRESLLKTPLAREAPYG